jgi:hypothetical protein
MRVRELELLLGQLTPRSKSDLDIRMRKLRQADLLPKGGRGPNAPNIGARDAAMMIIAICCSRHAVDAADAVPVFASLLPEYNDEAFEGAGTFAEALTAALARPETAKRIRDIEFSLPGNLEPTFSMGFPFCVISCPPNPPCYYVTEAYLSQGTNYSDTYQKRQRLRRETRRPPRRVMVHDSTSVEGALIVELASRLSPKAGSKGGGGRRRGRRAHGT